MEVAMNVRSPSGDGPAARHPGALLRWPVPAPAHHRLGTPQRRLDRRHCGFRRLVFPDAHDCPGFLLQGTRSRPVTYPVRLDLLVPPLSTSTRGLVVSWTAMPVAAIHEHGDASRTEDEVCSSPQVWFGSRVHVVSPAAAVQRRPDAHLRGCVALAGGAHPSRDLGSGFGRDPQAPVWAPGEGPIWAVLSSGRDGGQEAA